MKKIIAVLTSVLILGCMTACGDPDVPDIPEPPIAVGNNPTNEEIERKNITVYESENLTIVYEDSRLEEQYGINGNFEVYKIYIEIENHTDEVIEVVCYWMLDGYSFGNNAREEFSVPAGSKTMRDLWIRRKFIEEAGLDANAISEIQMEFTVNTKTEDGDSIPLEKISYKDCTFST